MADRNYRDPYDFTPIGGGDSRTSRTPAPPAVPVDYGSGTRTAQPDPWSGAPPAANGTYPQYPWVRTPIADTPAPVTPPGPAAFAGSPLNTMYGIDSESYLTDDQRKLARQIQGKFDASLDRRDRALAQYGAPRLSSFVEDEALARAMALSRGLNVPTRDALGMVQGSGPASRGGGGSGGGGPGGGTARAPTYSVARDPVARTVPPTASPGQAARWQAIVGGLTSLLPLLIGKNGMNGLMNDGLIKWLGQKYSETFPGAVLDPNAANTLINGGAAPTDSLVAYNPITGMPMGVDPSVGGYQDVYGPGSGWDQTPTPEVTAPDFGPGSEAGWGGDPYGGWDTGAGWWGDNNYWYPDASGAWDMADPFAVGGW